MTDPKPDDTTADTPAKTSHGDPLLAASDGATEGTEGSRHGREATAPDRQQEG